MWRNTFSLPVHVSQYQLYNNIRLISHVYITTLPILKKINHFSFLPWRCYSFIGDAKDQFEVLNNMYNKMNSLFEDMSKYYCFDKKKYNMEDFFGDIKIFQDSFKVLCSFILWDVFSMFSCWKNILPFPYKYYGTSIFDVQIIMHMTMHQYIYIYTQTCGHSADIQNCESKFITFYWKVMGMFWFKRAIAATPSKWYAKHCKRLHFLYNNFSILSPEDTCACLPNMIFDLYCSKPSMIMLNKERPMLDYNALKKPKSVLRKRRKREWQLAKVSTESLSILQGKV